jgi:ATP-dependent exoDNAse (exonuclease V) beta subunit
LIENYILGEKPLTEVTDDELAVQQIMPEDIELFKKLKIAADRSIDNLRSVEGQMWSDYLKVAGTVDLIADYNGRLSVIDWKTSAREKKYEYVDGYFMQAAAYAVMYEEHTGTPIDTLVVIIAHDESNEPQIFVEKRDDWIFKFIELREQYQPRSN